MKHFLTAALSVSCLLLVSLAQEPPRGWVRHTIDNSSVGADGVRLADVNHDGLPDIVTGWEEGGVVRVVFMPEPQRVRMQWPRVTVGEVPSVEDAVFVDLDSDGAMDVVSSAEGKTRSMFVHWGPRQATREGAWKMEPLPASANRFQWMFATPMQVDGRFGVDLVAGGKNKDAELGWFEASAKYRQLADWKWHALRPAGWIMSIIARDMDDDGIEDVLFSDRKGARSGVFWLKNPLDQSKPWTEHLIGAAGREVMFLDAADLDGDGFEDILAATKPREILWFRRLDKSGLKWETQSIPMDAKTGTAKSVRAADLDGDNRKEIVFTCEQTKGGTVGVGYLKLEGGKWVTHDISGGQGVKFDLVEMYDVDGDGDLDAITCEEISNLGVVWYENPFRKK
ncbi:MAG TPA: VCBS repeat-containing protein [Bryobacteraceae bacterium]|nr:VCBS repeat-containing protein [Bryobacteraceae bacterium]HPT25667.1 VCBS repeat-containing protein [Bryobacteraceae bacterium]